MNALVSETEITGVSFLRARIGRAQGHQGNQAEPTVVRSAAASRPERLRLTRHGRFVLLALPLFLLATVVLVSIGFLTAPLKAGAESLRGTEAVAVTVQPGDSLWSLAGQAALPRDAGDVVAEIVELNGLSTAVLQPGQSILLPSR